MIWATRMVEDHSSQFPGIFHRYIAAYPVQDFAVRVTANSTLAARTPCCHEIGGGCKKPARRSLQGNTHTYTYIYIIMCIHIYIYAAPYPCYTSDSVETTSTGCCAGSLSASKSRGHGSYVLALGPLKKIAPNTDPGDVLRFTCSLRETP